MTTRCGHSDLSYGFEFDECRAMKDLSETLVGIILTDLRPHLFKNTQRVNKIDKRMGGALMLFRDNECFYRSQKRNCIAVFKSSMKFRFGTFYFDAINALIR